MRVERSVRLSTIGGPAVARVPWYPKAAPFAGICLPQDDGARFPEFLRDSRIRWNLSSHEGVGASGIVHLVFCGDLILVLKSGTADSCGFS